ncbi:hypothetical protein C5B77_23150 [Aeromonas salmonicida]|nr:hypothetical protein C5B77_23150 [Aeromonas salmonicida]
MLIGIDQAKTCTVYVCCGCIISRHEKVYFIIILIVKIFSFSIFHLYLITLAIKVPCIKIRGNIDDDAFAKRNINIL